MRRSDSPELLPPRFVTFAWRYHPVRLSSFLPRSPTPTGGQEVSGLAPPTPRFVEMEATEASQVPREPAVFMPCSLTPAGPLQEALPCSDAAPAHSTTKAPHER